jgi:hypothetical protein
VGKGFGENKNMNEERNRLCSDATVGMMAGTSGWSRNLDFKISSMVAISDDDYWQILITDI